MEETISSTLYKCGVYTGQEEMNAMRWSCLLRLYLSLITGLVSKEVFPYTHGEEREREREGEREKERERACV